MRLVVFALLVLAVAGCKRPGTDRDLQCDRYGDLSVERAVECGGAVDGVKLTEGNATELAKKAKDACMANKALTPTADCIKQLKSAKCAGDVPDPAAMPACKAN